jgi:uncharacterized protein YecE (DUF72 family)
MIGDVTADFAYARLMKGADDIETGYAPADLDAWARRFEAYAAGGVPLDPRPVDATHAPARVKRDVFAFFISAGKLRAPAAAMALAHRLSGP